jgi:hypothetical protein
MKNNEIILDINSAVNQHKFQQERQIKQCFDIGLECLRSQMNERPEVADNTLLSESIRVSLIMLYK